MSKFSNQVENILKIKNEYNYDISLYYEVISYIPYFENINEKDYISHSNDRESKTFDYTSQFYSFIQALYNAKLVEEEDDMKNFLKSYDSDHPYNLWIKDMNMVLDDDNLFVNTNIEFLRKAIFSITILEDIIPGSWGIDVEAGIWLKILQQLKRILPEIDNDAKRNFN